MKPKRILHLVLKGTAFEVTGTPEKMFEIRHNSQWMQSRLFNKDGTARIYDEVHLVHGYSRFAPKKVFQFGGVNVIEDVKNYSFSNGLTFRALPGYYIIHLHKIDTH
jgi:hypothetical protein